MLEVEIAQHDRSGPYLRGILDAVDRLTLVLQPRGIANR
jgi:hypothetical protein